MSIDEKTLKSIRELDMALPDNAARLNQDELCEIYKKFKPVLDVVIKWIEKIPGYGQTVAKWIRLLETLANMACNITPQASEPGENVTMAHGEGTHPFSATSMAYVYWTFSGDIRRGDCTIRSGATFYLYQDGSTRWVCDISSSDSGDEWDGDFVCTNAGGVQLWSDHYHFDISDEGVWKRWDESRGPNGNRAASFGEARGLTFFCSC